MPKACTKDPPMEPPMEPEITMTTQASKVEIWVGITLSKGSDNFAIDWGDGEISNIDNYSFNTSSPHIDEDVYKFSHIYSGVSKHHITITGDNIEGLGCASNQLTDLNVRRYPNLSSLICSYNKLTALDVSNTELIWLECAYNLLTTIDVSNCIALDELRVTNCPLINLDVSSCAALSLLYVSDCQLAALDVSKNTALSRLYCDGNKLTASALNDLFRTLRTLPGGKNALPGYWIYIRSNPGTDYCDFSIAEEKGWMFGRASQKEVWNSMKNCILFFKTNNNNIIINDKL